MSNAHNPYAKIIKEFETYGRASHNHSGKKEGQRYSKEGKYYEKEKDKYRIVTEPVDNNIMNLGKSNIFNSSFGKLPASRKKIEK